MESSLQVSPPRGPLRPLLAALKLASVYTGAVVLISSALILLEPSEFSWWQTFMYLLAIPTAVCFVIAVVSLAVGRRFGFTVMWAMLCGLWLWSWVASPEGSDPGPNFVLWTVLSAPLYLICATGFSPVLSPRYRWYPFALAAIWAGLAVAGVPGVRIRVDAIQSALDAAWMVFPLVLTTLMVYRIHRRDGDIAPAT